MASFKSMDTSQDLANSNTEFSNGKSCIHGTISTYFKHRIWKHYSEHTSNFLTGIELDVIFSLLNSSGTEMITCSMIHPGHGANIILHG